jgi:hypothetical protein
LDTHISLALAAALGLGVAACEDLTDPNEHRVGDPAPEVALDVAAAGGVPSGALSVEDFEFIVDTVGVSDVFQRAGADGYYPPGQWRYVFDSGVRIAGQDPRLPALAPLPDPELFSTGFTRVMGPEWFGPMLWDFYMRWYGLDPAKTYTFSVERLALSVNGALDALELIIDSQVTEPDELVPLGGSPGGYPDNDYAWTTTTGCTLEPIPDPPPNPWYLGVFTPTAGEGRGTADFCMGTPWLWYTDWVNEPDSSIVAPNELATGVVPQYNYVVVYEGEPPNLGPPVIRIQMGVDFDLSGNPLPNGFAPFPLLQERQTVLEREMEVDLPNVAVVPTQIRFEIRDLEPLAGDVPYEAWLLNVETGNSIRATADYFQIETIIVTDTLGQQSEVDVPGDTTRTATFPGVAASNVRHAFILRNSMIDPQRLGGFTHVVLAKPGVSGSASEPVFWAEFLDQKETPDVPLDDITLAADDFKLGALNWTDPDSTRTFRISGSGDGAIWGDELALQFRRLSRPPPGYVYEVWLVDAEGEATSIGPLTGPKPGYVDITDADSVVHEEFMTATQILQATKLLKLTGAIDLSQFSEIQLTLEPRAGAADKGPTLILSGSLPE